MNRWRLAGILTVCLLVLAACGYHLGGHGRLPGGVTAINVQVVTNRTAESGLETTVTNAVIDQLTLRRQGLVVAPGQAEAILSGTIDRLATDTVARSSTLTAAERRVVVTVSFRLKDRSGKLLWQSGPVSAEQAYAVVESRAATAMNRRLAIGLAAQRLADLLFDRLTDTF